MFRALSIAIAVLCLLPTAAAAQMTYRIKGTVRDNDGKPVSGATVRAEALVGFRGAEFAGQREFVVKSNEKGEWVILGVISGLWSFEASGADVIPRVVIMPVNFNLRQPVSARGGSFSWDLPLVVRRTTNATLTSAAAAATTRRADEAVASIGALGTDDNPDVLCSAGELALMVRQHALARVLFEQAVKREARHPCATQGLASAALMQNDYDRATKLLWDAVELAPRDLKPALGAALKDMQAIAGINKQ